MKPKLNKWYPLKTRFKVVKANTIEQGYPAKKQGRLVIEFPMEYRKGWFPFELSLEEKIFNPKAQPHTGMTNYWSNPFGVEMIEEVIRAVQVLDGVTVPITKQEKSAIKEFLKRYRLEKLGIAHNNLKIRTAKASIKR